MVVVVIRLDQSLLAHQSAENLSLTLLQGTAARLAPTGPLHGPKGSVRRLHVLTTSLQTGDMENLCR